MTMEYVQPIAAGAIAVFAAAIAYGQYLTARQKLALDLFEKRFAVFMDVRNIISEIIQHGSLQNEGFPKEVLARAKFLFGKDVVDEINSLATMTADPRPKAFVADELLALLQRLEPLFHNYIGMDQKLPTWPSIRRR